jgi:hypothetical protein
MTGTDLRILVVGAGFAASLPAILDSLDPDGVMYVARSRRWPSRTAWSWPSASPPGAASRHWVLAQTHRRDRNYRPLLELP